MKITWFNLKKDEQNGFTLQFNQEIQSAYLITYQTKATDRIFEAEEIINTVTAGKESKQAKQRIDQQILTKTTEHRITRTRPFHGISPLTKINKP